MANVTLAIDDALHQAHSLAVWDGFIVQAALEAECDLLLSEDFQHGRRFGGLEVFNPFLNASAHEPAGPGHGTKAARQAARRAAPPRLTR